MKRKMMIKKAVALVLTFSMAFSIAACGDSGRAEEVKEQETGQQATEEKEAEQGTGQETAEAGSEKTKISFWAPFSGGDGDIMTELVDEFNAQSSTTEVEFMIIKSEEYYTKLLAAMTTDTAPTVAVNHITRIKEYVNDGLIEPLDDLASAAGVDFGEFTERLQASAEIDGKYYCMPMDTHLLLMHFNTDEFERMGLLEEDGTVKVPRGEEAFFEYFHNVKSQLGNGQIPISGTSMNGLPMYLWYTLLTQYGGDICDETGSTATLNSEENIKALSVIMRMVDEEIWPKNQKNGGELFTGKIAPATINGVWAVPMFEGTEGLNFVSMPFPQFTDKDSVYADSHTLVIPKNKNTTEEEKVAAMEFMKWLTDNTAKWARAGHIPSKQSVIDSEEFRNLPYRSVYADSAQYAKIFPQVCGIAGLTELTYRELAAMIAGSQDVETTAENMQNGFQEILDSYK